VTKEDSKTRCPKDHPHEVVYDVWQGINLWCDCKSKLGVKYILINNDCLNVQDGLCTKQDAVSPLVIDNLGGYKVCGKRGTPFVDMVRAVVAKPKKGEKVDPKKPLAWGCQKEGYIPCNLEGDPETVICVATKEELVNCPINDIKWVKNLYAATKILV